MSSLSRALVLGVLVTLAVWLLTLDWSGGLARSVSLIAPLPGLAAGLLAAVVTLVLPAGEQLAKRRSKKAASRTYPLIVPGAIGGLIALGVAGSQVSAGQLAGVVTGLTRQMAAPAALGSGTSNTKSDRTDTAKVGEASAGKSGTSELSDRTGAAPAGPAKTTGTSAKGDAPPAPTATATAASSAKGPAASPTITVDPTRSELTALTYETYPEAGAGSLTLTFRDRQLNRPVLAYYEMVRDTTSLTLTMSATAPQSVARTPNDDLIKSIEQKTSNGRLQILIRLARPGIAVVDETSSGKDGIQLTLVPDAGFGSLTRAPTALPSVTPEGAPAATPTPVRSPAATSAG